MTAYPFPPEQLYCILDFETFSEADLKKVGAYEYSTHESTDILCVAWRIGTKPELKNAPVFTWSPSLDGVTLGGKLADLGNILSRQDVVIVAHNALFEQVITKNVLKRHYLTGLGPTPPSRWICTASLASSLALPRNLAGAGEVLSLPIQKDKEGHRLMLKWCKPRKATIRNPATRHTDPNELKRLIDYCKKDVEAETLVFLKCPPLNPLERKVWELDQKINLRGFLVDRPLVLKVLRMLEEETALIDENTRWMTGGLLNSARQRDALLQWLSLEGVILPDATKKTVETALKTGVINGNAKEILTYRQAISKTSTAKYQAFERRTRFDHRLRDILVYHTASTGRWGGAGVQPQNFPRGVLDVDTVLASSHLGDCDLEEIRLLYGDPMAVFSSCLRNMIIAPKGKTFDVADYAAIEARVLAWVAGDQDALQAFRNGVDPYKKLASKIYGVPVEDVTKEMRWLGKQAELGCGYGMGKKKFGETCAGYDVKISEELAALAVDTYRENHPAIKDFWTNINEAAKAAIANPGVAVNCGPVRWYVKTRFLWCVLPSGRRLAYPSPSLEWIDPPEDWNTDRKILTLFHFGINPYSRKWERQKTYGGKLTENVVQAISRDLMAEAMLRIEDTGKWEIVLSVHDELIAERDIFGDGSLEEFESLMAEIPPWAKGCPVKVEGWTGDRYRK